MEHLQWNELHQIDPRHENELDGQTVELRNNIMNWRNELNEQENIIN